MMSIKFPHPLMTRKLQHAAVLALMACCAACSSIEDAHQGFRLPAPSSSTGAEPRTFELGKQQELDELTTLLSTKRALFIGEIHDRPEHHQNQLLIIQNLYARHTNLAIGVEYFQQPFQTYLDDFLAGRINEKQMLLKTEYYKRWQMDYRMLQPILDFARQNHIPVVALNISSEIHSKVFDGGMNSLSPEERAQIPYDLQPAGEDYRQRLKAIFDSHPQGDNFDNFVTGQLLWDEAMAETATRYLQDHPQSRMVILAGLGHMMYGDGIPRQVNRHLGGNQSAVVINGNDFGKYPGIADFLLATSGAQELPKAGKLGIVIADGVDSVRIESFVPNSSAEAAGMKSGDNIVVLDGIKVSNVAEMKVQMFDKQPGQRIRIVVRRAGTAEELSFGVELH